VRRDLAVAACLAVLAAAIGGVAAAPASGASLCAKQVIEDWRDNGEMDRRYALHCYEEAIDALPEELRIYTNAPDVIRKAYLAGGGTRTLAGPKSVKVRSSGPGPGPPPPTVAPAINTSATTDVPLPVFVLGALALVLLGAGALGYVSRRRSRSDDEPPPA
jgi:hypothetical protein